MYRGTNPTFYISIKLPPAYKSSETSEVIYPFQKYQVRGVLSQGAATSLVKTFSTADVTTEIIEKGVIKLPWRLSTDEINQFEANMPLRFQARVWFYSNIEGVTTELTMASDSVEVELGYIADVIDHSEWGEPNE